jgi:hypothetical protein
MKLLCVINQVSLDSYIFIYKYNVMEKDLALTSVKIKKDLFEEFKIECVKRKFTLNKLVNRAVFLYITNEDFRKTLHNQTTIGK